MTSLPTDRVLQFRGDDLIDRSGDKIGVIEEIYLDAETNEPEWALVHTGMFGQKRSFVPLRDAIEEDGKLTVPLDKATVKDAPPVEANGQLSQREEAELYRHFGLEHADAGAGAGDGDG
jgi:hypothetical protein